MKNKLLLTFFFSFLFYSCGQDYNSNSFDKDKFSNDIDVSTPAGQQFAQAYSVIELNCISCHTGYHSTYASYKTSADWVSAGLVNAGDFENSYLILKLKNYGGNMPLSGSELSSDDIATLRSWIESL